MPPRLHAGGVDLAQQVVDGMNEHHADRRRRIAELADGARELFTRARRAGIASSPDLSDVDDLDALEMLLEAGEGFVSVFERDRAARGAR